MNRENDILKDVKILLVVTGGIAAYKSADLASKLTARAASVDCILTKHASKLIKPITFQTVTSRPVYTSMWKPIAASEFKIDHINLAESADIVVVAPATANIIAKMANGICDDMASTTLCAVWAKPILMAPAMNSNMYANPAVQKNIDTLKSMNVTMIGPETGRLACGTEGPGRMTEPADIIIAIEKIAASLK
ncbi:MAG: phosphopantothenoylcysteine decarboxylase [Planctomycetes bacterium]|nr:phosphopantothenoylcysteine decarboxylase [Planctomycetota bacterium]